MSFRSHIKNYNNISKAGAISVSLLFLMMLGLSFPLVPHTDSAEAAPSPTSSESTIAMVADHESAELTLVPNSNTGVFATSTEEDLAKFSVTTNSHTGYTVSVLGADDTGKLVSPDSETALESIDTMIGKSVFQEKTDYNGKWGFRPNKFVVGNTTLDNTLLDIYLPSPTASGTTLDITSAANTTPNDYTIALGARADNTFPYGVYSKTFTLVAVGNPATYNIIYADNTGDTSVTNMPDATTGDSSAVGVELSSRVPVRDNYTFKSWCSEAPVDGACPSSATEYNPGATFYLDQTADNSITLYATWTLNTYDLVINFAGEGVESVKVCTVAGDCSGDDLIGTVSASGGYVSNLIFDRSYYLYPSFTTLNTFLSWAKTGGQGSISATTDINPTFTMGSGDGEVTVTGRKMTMQEFGSLTTQKPEVISRMGEEEVYTLTDSRDNKEYTIAKLKDGQVWMTSNLNLAGGTTLNASDSDVPTDNYFTLPASSASGFSSDTTAYVYNSGNETTNQADCTGSQPCNSYYSWLAATAGGKDASGTAVTGNGPDAAYSICPKGWRLPKSGNQSDTSATSTTGYKKGDFYKLATAYGANLESSYYQNSAVFYQNAGPGTLPNFLLAGLYYSSSFYYGGTYGRYWSSSSYSSTYAYYLVFGSSDVNSAGRDNRRYGFSVRCILDRDPIEENNITTMQDFSSLTAEKKTEVVDQMNTEKVYALKDSRDNKSYTIAKLKDGQVWMTSDLNLAGGTTLNASDSDVPTDNYFTLPASSTTGFDDNTQAYVYNSGNETTNQADCTGSQPCNSYYSWLAATAGGKDASGTAVTGDGPDAAYSICPKGWRLPKSGNMNDTSATSTTGYKKGDFYKLATAYGANLESQYYQDSAVFYNNAGPGTLPNFLLAGYYNSSSFYHGGTSGSYWSSSSYSSTYAYDLLFYSSNVYSASYSYRRSGFSVRCMLR